MLPVGSQVSKTFCLDKRCQNVLYIHSNEKVIECHSCGQIHNRSSLQDIQDVRSDEINKALQSYLYRLCLFRNIPKRGTEMVKVLGLSNYHCKLLSPLLTRYGMDKNTGRAKLLTEMNQGEIFDCSLFRDRAFLIEPEHISIHGFGKDITGSVEYLSETLKLIVSYNGGEERLIPIHADGDGHCLVHAVSRALIGRELFWHPLRCCLKKHFQTNLDNYKELFKDFIDTDEWSSIIEECDPDFQPPEDEFHGLRNIHIFGLANVLRRPIILLDSLECMQKCGDYSALFLPGFVSPEMCKGKDNTLNKPLCIAWSSQSHNHYIPLVGIQKMPLPSLPAALIPKVWGMPQSQISSYMEFDSNNGCIIGGNRTLSDAYIQRLVHAMETLYYEKNGVHPLLVADAKLYLYLDNLFCTKTAMVLERTKAAVQEGRLYRCLICKALCELSRPDDKLSSNNSAICSQLLQDLKKIQDSNLSVQDFIMRYDPMNQDIIIDIRPEACAFCTSQTLRKVTNDGTVIYQAEDKDNLDRNIHMYEPSKRYFPDDSVSQKPTKESKQSRIPIKLIWDGREIEDEIPCFEFFNNSKPNINQFIKDLSEKFLEKHFSAYSVDADLQEYVVQEIWKTIKQYDFKSSSDSSYKPEFMSQDSAKAMKLETPISYHSKPSEIQYIKVCTSNGLQANFALTDEGVSYGQLQEWIKNEFKIPIKNQVIKKGVPPRLIKPSGDTNKQILTDLKHGDRLIVEIQRRDDTPYSSNTCSPPRNILKDSNTSKSTLKYTNDTRWDNIKKLPANFKRYGPIYEMIKENYTLDYLMHISLDEYPGKVFCYNKFTDSIELCVEPYGHFRAFADIDSEIKDIKSGFKPTGHSECPLSIKYPKMDDDDDDDILNFVTFQSIPANKKQCSLIRKGPGISVLEKPHNMDFS